MYTAIPMFGWFFIILIAFYGMIIWYRMIKTVELKVVIDIILFIGVIIHDLTHACLLLCMKIMPDSFSVRYRSRFTEKASPHGDVGLCEQEEVRR